MTAKVYTKKGDRGKMSLFSGRRVEKFDLRVAAVGDLDELSASIGLARVAYPPANDLLRSVQRALYAISAIVSAENRAVKMALVQNSMQETKWCLVVQFNQAASTAVQISGTVLPATRSLPNAN